MNKLVKNVFVGVAFYGVAELNYLYGKGTMVGLLAKYDIGARDAIDALEQDKRITARIIGRIAKLHMIEKGS